MNPIGLRTAQLPPNMMPARMPAAPPTSTQDARFMTPPAYPLVRTRFTALITILGPPLQGGGCRAECSNGPTPRTRLTGGYGLRQGDQVLRQHADDARARAVNIGDQEERNRHDNRQDKCQPACVALSISEQQAARYGDQAHQSPGRDWYAIPPRRLSVTLRVQHIVHARHDKGFHSGLLRGQSTQHARPKLGLQPCSFGVDLGDLTGIASNIERDALIEVAPQQVAQLRGLRGRQNIGAQIFGANRVGLSFLEILALVVAAHRHREAEANDETKEGESGSSNEVEIPRSSSLSGRTFLRNTSPAYAASHCPTRATAKSTNGESKAPN